MRKFTRWTLYALWLFLVLYLSLVPSDDAPDVSIPYIDKVAHFGFYFGAVFLYLNAKLHLSLMMTQKRVVFTAVLGHFLMSGGVELMQMFMSVGRAAEWIDLLFNAIGAFSAPFFYWFWSNNFSVKKTEMEEN